jgi:DDE superfamily endonuclease
MKEQRAENRALSSVRTVVEHVIGRLKVFRVLNEAYRHRRRFGLRVSLIAGLYNASVTTQRCRPRNSIQSNPYGMGEARLFGSSAVLISERNVSLVFCGIDPVAAFSSLKQETQVLNLASLTSLFGGPCWTRTNNPLIKSQLLCQLS